MKRTIGFMAIIYGISLSSYYGLWALKDNATPGERLPSQCPPRAEMRHRINVTAQGIWFLLSNIIILQGVGLALPNKRKCDKVSSR